MCLEAEACRPYHRMTQKNPALTVEEKREEDEESGGLPAENILGPHTLEHSKTPF